jgi:restriction endonuclease Mrr
VEPLRDLHQAMQQSGGQECIFITTGSFTDNAIAYAAEKKMRLLHGVALVTFLRELKAPVRAKK